jgi:hypothetical protein
MTGRMVGPILNKPKCSYTKYHQPMVIKRLAGKTRSIVIITFCGLLLFLNSGELFAVVLPETYAQPTPTCNPSTTFCEPLSAKQNSSTTTLVIFNHVNDTLGGKVRSSNFSIIIANLNTTNGQTHRITQTYDFINGSETGTILQMMPGSFFVSQNNRISPPITRAYNITFSGDCHTFRTSNGGILALGNIHAGQTSTCYISRSLLTHG